MTRVIPIPLHVERSPGTLRLAGGMALAAADPDLGRPAASFCRELRRRTDIALRLDPAAERPAIRVERAKPAALESAAREPIGLSPAAEDVPDERYTLAVAGDGAIVRAATAAGAARGLTTLLQLALLDAGDDRGAAAVPAVRIADGPRFAWRGLTLDVARAAVTVDELKRVVDLLALYKLNVLHLHLTDDDAWRIVAGRPGRRPGEGAYTDDDLREVIAYGEERFVTLLAEVDSPGHVASLLRLRPELQTGHNTVRFGSADAVHRSAWLDPGHPGTLGCIEEVLAEVAALFPCRFLHVGGDEPFGMPADLYARYVRHVCGSVRSLGRQPVGWQETVRAGDGGPDVIQHWISSPEPSAAADGASAPLPPPIAANLAPSRRDIAAALERSIPIIVSPARNAYLDAPYAEPAGDPGQEARWARVGLPAAPRRTVAETFDWDPLTALGPAAGAEAVAGVGCALWGETIGGFDDLTFLLLPRLAGCAERAWSEPGVVGGWDAHRGRLAAHGPLWTADGLTWFRSSLVDWMR